MAAKKQSGHGATQPSDGGQTRSLISLCGAALAVAVLAASWLTYPGVPLVSTAGSACPEAKDRAVLLYARGAASVYLTGKDILWPNDFLPPGDRIYASVLGYDVPSARQPSWNLMVLRALRMETPDGEPILDPAQLSDVDKSLRSQWGDLFPPASNVPTALALKAGEAHVFALSPDSSYARGSGLGAVIPVGLSAGTDAQGTALAATLAGIDAATGRASRQGIAISYGHLASAGNKDADLVGNFAALLGAVENALAPGHFRKVVIGTWARLPAQALRQVTAFCTAWAQFEPTLARDAGTLAHGPLRLASVGVLAAFLGAWLRREPMTAMVAIAYIAVIGGVLATFFGLLDLLAPLISSLAGPGVLFGLQFLVAALCGWHLRRLSRYQPGDLLRAGPTS